MRQRRFFVVAQIACLTACLVWAGCGKDTSEPPTVGASVSQTTAPRQVSPLLALPPVNQSVPGTENGGDVIPVHYIAPLVQVGPAPADLKVDREQLDRAIDLAGEYLIRACGDDGQFVYRAHLNPGVEQPRDYNMLRHAGAIYALGMYREWQSEPSAGPAMVRAVGFLRDEALAPLEGQKDVMAVWSPAESGSSSMFEAKLGGAGLGLVALASAERFRSGTTPLDEMRGLGAFILYMQKPDGGFFSKYIPLQGGRSDTWTSLYYPGEAALGLLMLYQVDPQPQWREGAERALAYLARCRRNQAVVEADHWALLATARLFELAEQEKWKIDRAGLIYHAAQICQQMLEDMPDTMPSGATAGCLTTDGRTCPTATRLEGMQAVLPLLATECAPMCTRMISAIDAAIAFLVRTQVPSGPYAGGIPRSAILIMQEADRCQEVRIDYVQHALSAMLQYHSQRFGGK